MKPFQRDDNATHTGNPETPKMTDHSPLTEWKAAHPKEAAELERWTLDYAEDRLDPEGYRARNTKHIASPMSEAGYPLKKKKAKS